MTEAALSALAEIFGCPCLGGVFPTRLLLMFLGVVIGITLGLVPGLSGIVGLAVMLPFTFSLDPATAMALILGMLATTGMSDQIPAILFGIPGTAASQATILDGYAMSKKGEAARAFGASFMSSMLGGLFGAAILALAIPLLRPVVLAFAAPEFFMLGVLGISMVAMLSGGSMRKGLAAGVIGLLIGMVGMDPQSGTLRWTHDQLYLSDGISLAVLALGLFALPELVDLVIKGRGVAGELSLNEGAGTAQGVRDALKNWFLVMRCSALGTWIGLVPGLGGAVVDWFAYGHAMTSEKGAKDSFGKGDVRGVIAPESAANAKVGGALLPTIAFGVPGSAVMALLLGALLVHGLTPGPQMLTDNLDITYTMIWSLAIANVLAAGICLLLAKRLSKVSLVRPHLLFPVLVVFVYLAAYQSTRSMGDLYTVLAFGILGWLMKRFRWSRPPLLLGAVLSRMVETSFYISVTRYGAFGWLTRPIVLVVLAILVGTVARKQWSAMRARQLASEPGSGPDDHDGPASEDLLDAEPLS